MSPEYKLISSPDSLRTYSDHPVLVDLRGWLQRKLKGSVSERARVAETFAESVHQFYHRIIGNELLPQDTLFGLTAAEEQRLVDVSLYILVPDGIYASRDWPRIVVPLIHTAFVDEIGHPFVNPTGHLRYVPESLLLAGSFEKTLPQIAQDDRARWQGILRPESLPI